MLWDGPYNWCCFCSNFLTTFWHWINSGFHINNQVVFGSTRSLTLYYGYFSSWGVGPAILQCEFNAAASWGGTCQNEGYFSDLNKKKKKKIENLGKTVRLLPELKGWKCLSLQDSVGHHFWLHMCLSILWSQALKACRNTHALPETIQGHKHFPFFPRRNSPCPRLTEKQSSKDNFAWMTG